MSGTIITDGDGIAYRAFPKHGAWFGVAYSQHGRPTLLSIAMRKDGAPETDQAGDLCVFDVCNIEPGDTCLTSINAAFGTRFRREDFPGR